MNGVVGDWLELGVRESFLEEVVHQLGPGGGRPGLEMAD